DAWPPMAVALNAEGPKGVFKPTLSVSTRSGTSAGRILTGIEDDTSWRTSYFKGSTLMPRSGQRPFDTAFSPIQCTAHSKRTGKRCRNFCIRGRSVCKFHGGRSLRGQAHPNYKNGIYCKDTKEAAKMLAHFLERPIEVKVVLWQEPTAHGQHITGSV